MVSKLLFLKSCKVDITTFISKIWKPRLRTLVHNEKLVEELKFSLIEFNWMEKSQIKKVRWFSSMLSEPLFLYENECACSIGIIVRRKLNYTYLLLWSCTLYIWYYIVTSCMSASPLKSMMKLLCSSKWLGLHLVHFCIPAPNKMPDLQKIIPVWIDELHQNITLSS